MQARARRAVISLAIAIGLALPAGPITAQSNGPASVAALARQLQDAVVNISSSHMVPGGLRTPVLPEGSPLEEFFNERQEGPDGMPLLEAVSLGSGFIISPEGVIVTNNHVVEGAQEVFVQLTDGRRLLAEVIGQDDKTDLAILKVQAEAPLDFVELGDSDTAEVGDWVMAIGNPFGLGGSVSIGIVSARNRNINSGPYDNFIQTDAAINQGNSGGPLFDMDGNVVGINTAILSRTGSSLGIGFAIPINLAAPVVDQLSEFGETRRGWLGVGIQAVTDEMAREMGRTGTGGALVLNVTRGGPGEGVIETGDVIIAFNGEPIVEMRDLPRLVAETPVGTESDVLVVRDGEEITLEVTLGRLETGEEIMAQNALEDAERRSDAPPPPAPVGRDPSSFMGFSFEDLDTGLRDTFGLEPDADGLVVTEVEEGSDAGDKGITPGLILAEINQRPVTSREQATIYLRSLERAGGNAVMLTLRDAEGEMRYEAVEIAR